MNTHLGELSLLPRLLNSHLSLRGYNAVGLYYVLYHGLAIDISMVWQIILIYGDFSWAGGAGLRSARSHDVV